jgi:hypothetical protein
MKVYLVKEHVALNDGQRESVASAYLDKKNAELDAKSRVHTQYIHWLIDAVEVRDARSVMKKREHSSHQHGNRVRSRH